jgi:hypothetical protein
MRPREVFPVNGLFLLALTVLFILPSLLSLTPAGYDYASLAHLATFLAAMILFVWLGRISARRGLGGGRRGLWVGAVSGGLGALGSASVSHTPPANRAFVTELAARGVPPAAAYTLHSLHVVTTALLTALAAAAFYAVAGAFGAWWGARPGLLRRRHPPIKGGPAT